MLKLGNASARNHADARRGVKFMRSKGSADAGVTAADNEDRQRHSSMVQIQPPSRLRKSAPCPEGVLT